MKAQNAMVEQMMDQDRQIGRMVAHADYRKHAQDDYNKMLKDQMMNDMANKDQMRMAERMYDRNEVAQKNAAYMSIDQMEKN